MNLATELEFEHEQEQEHEAETEHEAQAEHELAAELLEVHETAELEGFLPLLIGPVMAGLKALAPVAIKAAVPLLKQVGAKVLPKLAGNLFGGGTRRRRATPRRELEAELEAGEMEGFLPIIGSVVSGLLGGEMEAENSEYEIARRYVRLSRLAGKRAARQISGMLRRGVQPTSRILRRVVAGAVRSAAETLFGGESSRDTELATELLEMHEVHELEQFLGNLIGPALRGLKKIAPVVMKAAVPMLKNVASQALPGIVNGVLGGGADEAEGELEGFLGNVIGGLFGGEMELEGEAELARAEWLVRIAKSAGRRAASALRAHIARSGEPSWSTIRQIVANAILGAAGGGSPAAAAAAPTGTALPPAPVATTNGQARPAPARSGTWVRSGGNLIVYL